MQGTKTLSAVARRPDVCEGGYAAVDAMVALLIVALTSALCIRLGDQAIRTARRAHEIQTASVVLDGLLQRPASNRSAMQGEVDAFRWSLRNDVADAGRPIAICSRSGEIVSSQSGRRYDLSALAPCPMEGGA